MKTKELNKFNALIAALEKQAAHNVFTFYDLETYDFYVFNEYSVIKLYPAYCQAIQNTRPSLPGVDDLILAAKNGGGYVYRVDDKSPAAFIKLSDDTTKAVKNLAVYEHEETTDTNIQDNNIFNEHEYKKHYFINSNYVIAVNAAIHNAVMNLYKTMDVYPYFYSTTDIRPVVYSVPGIEVAILPIRLNQADKIPQALKSIYQFQTLTTKKAVMI